MDSKSKKDQKPVANQTLSSKIQALDELNRTIQRATEQLKKLCQQRDELEAEIFTIQSTNAPIERLPVEVFSRIFEDCVFPVAETTQTYEEASIRVNTIQLVCKSWQISPPIPIPSGGIYSFRSP